MELTINLREGRKIYRTDNGGLLVTTVHKNGLLTEEHYAYEKIRKETEYYKQTYIAYLIIAGIILFFGLAAVSDQKDNEIEHLPWNVYLIIGGLVGGLLLGFWLHRRNIFILKTTSGKFIHCPIVNNEHEILAFVNYTISTRNEFLKLKYGVPNEFLSYDVQYSNFSLLLREGAMTSDEFKTNIKKLSETFRQTLPGQTFTDFSSN